MRNALAAVAPVDRAAGEGTRAGADDRAERAVAAAPRDLVAEQAAGDRADDRAGRAAAALTTVIVVAAIVGALIIIALIGVALGLGGAYVLTKYLETLTKMLFGVEPRDPLTYGVTAALLTVVALLATFIPARRATKVDPMVALRYE